ncbi:MAG TPA: DNA polymerase III subunit beta [Solirubrobacteraceae bacterium]|nr:DNA polymerase III subunit beta [Solirubrobacteraceae bacterium]
MAATTVQSSTLGGAPTSASRPTPIAARLCITYSLGSTTKEFRPKLLKYFLGSAHNYTQPQHLKPQYPPAYRLLTAPTTSISQANSYSQGAFVKISCSTAELLNQLQTVTRVASTRSAVQALSGVKLSATPTAAELLATDMDVGLRVPLQAEIDRPGEVVLPARLLLDVARALPAESVSLELRTAEQDVELISGSATFHLRTLRVEDFPALPMPSGDARVVLPAEAFVQTIARVARSASKDETRPILTGILMSASERELRMVATDSYRLSVKQTTLESPLQGTLEANVPARALQELVRIAQQSESTDVAVSVGQNQVVFELNGTTLSSRLLDGQFPNYRQLLPESVEHELRIATTELTEVVRRISLLAQKNTPLRLGFREGELAVSAHTPDVGEASETIPVPFHGEPFEIGFNPEFLRDGLESLESDELVLKLISPLRPGLIESPESGDFVYLIMPIRLNV